ncbi:ribonuclease III [Oscillospiraceae bacterium CM]|nr:ribonuclease III [Oscillospiraceae bacterium CM]
MDKLEQKLGYTFRDRSLLQTALTHSSYANENKKDGVLYNERLEFLGDAVLGFIVAEQLYHKKPPIPEGQMTRLRAELVCEKSLEAAANRLGLGAHLRLGRGEAQGGGRQRPSILADAMEALVAAVYSDGGIDAAKTIVERLILENYDFGGEPSGGDFKTALQELVQKKSGQTLAYALVGARGPDHQKEFIVEVLLNGIKKGEGIGRSKKEAEQAAAKMALRALAK